MRQHTSRPFHAPHRDESRPLSLASERHEDGVRFPPHALMSPRRASQSAHVCMRRCACAHALVCLCACAFALVLRACVCLRGSAWMLLCVRASACLCHPACASACMHATRCLTSPPTRMRSARSLRFEHVRTTAAALLRWPYAPTAASAHGICRGAHRSMGHPKLPCTPAVAASMGGSMACLHTFSSRATCRTHARRTQIAQHTPPHSKSGRWGRGEASAHVRSDAA
jgi:hypothetical protein